MGAQEMDSAGVSHRGQTDESLRVEREKADAAVTLKRRAIEEKTDEVVRVARDISDEVVQTARDEADRDRASQTPSAERERSREDVLVDRARSLADEVLRNERAERKRVMDDFLAVEREATDNDLLGERAHADTMLAARDQLLANVSHDLRSLLAGLALNAERLLLQSPEGPSGHEMRAHATSSRRLVSRMNRLVNDLLDIASIEAGKLALLPEEVEVARILQDTLDAFGAIATAKGITLDADAASMPPDTRLGLDGGRILQVLANLVSNAIKFTRPGGRVSIRIHTEGDELRFDVSDTGIGIPADRLPAIFDRFTQASLDRRGLGLGLHISKHIVEAHAGRLWAESTPGVGSTFHVALPAAPRASSASDG